MVDHHITTTPRVPQAIRHKQAVIRRNVKKYRFDAVLAGRSALFRCRGLLPAGGLGFAAFRFLQLGEGRFQGSDPVFQRLLFEPGLGSHRLDSLGIELASMGSGLF